MVWQRGKKLFGDRYIIENILGEGGMGITYLAKKQSGELRVIKTLREDILEHPAWKPYENKILQDFRDEAVRLAVCRHPHIVEIKTIFDQENLPCMAMEYIEGTDLGKYLRRMGVLSEAEALLYIHQIGDALEVIHRRGLLHRDIKPGNIIIRQGKSEAVLIDFGIAREFIPNEVQKHTVYRTPGFAPPEQYQISALRGEFIDVYALAATLYTIITGIIPPAAEDRGKNTLLKPPQDLNPHISDRTNQAIMRGMALNSKYRPQSVQEWLQLLEKPTHENKILATVPPTQIVTSPRPSLLLYRWKCVNTLEADTSMVHAVTISPDGKIFASGSDKTIKLWDLESGKQLRQLGGWFSSHSGIVDSLAFSGDGEVIVSGSWDETIKLWSVSTGRQIRTLKGHNSSVNTLAFSPDNQLLASGSLDCTIKLWHIITGREVGNLTGHSASINAVAWSPDGQFLASASADCTIKIWQATGREIHTLYGHSLFVNSIAYSQDGTMLVSGSSDNTIKVWQASTGEEIRTLKGHSNAVWTVALSPDRQFIVSGSWDKTIKIWLLSTGKEICTLKGHSNYVRSVDISHNGQTLVSGSDDYTIKIWQQH
ncbi:WD40 repeat-containing protein [Rivularia sp. PCC 7116]|uniref:serine/threonine-protein kinase n=1 Tax=Rivularia sp. PCC 7116 TaxID=373994 RepID=UPI00029F14FE|nr:serine/threonine-protein kinase [Rivularia sp. PCC 7116]AFY53935.1 WD40 repeat-containing protein [Rivularia sp. PCC 7116]